MEYTCVLEAAGFTATLRLQPHPRDPEYAQIETSLQLDPSLGTLLLAPSRGLIAFVDLTRLADYLANHLRGLPKPGSYDPANDPGGEEMTFLTYDLTFQLTALSGVYDPATDQGAFDLRFLLNAGRYPQADAGSFVWIGTESSVQVPQVRAFTTSLRTAVAGLVTPDP